MGSAVLSCTQGKRQACVGDGSPAGGWAHHCGRQVAGRVRSAQKAHAQLPAVHPAALLADQLRVPACCPCRLCAVAWQSGRAAGSWLNCRLPKQAGQGAWQRSAAVLAETAQELLHKMMKELLRAGCCHGCCHHDGCSRKPPRPATSAQASLLVGIPPGSSMACSSCCQLRTGPALWCASASTATPAASLCSCSRLPRACAHGTRHVRHCVRHSTAGVAFGRGTLRGALPLTDQGVRLPAQPMAARCC